MAGRPRRRARRNGEFKLISPRLYEVTGSKGTAIVTNEPDEGEDLFVVTLYSTNFPYGLLVDDNTSLLIAKRIAQREAGTPTTATRQNPLLSTELTGIDAWQKGYAEGLFVIAPRGGRLRPAKDPNGNPAMVQEGTGRPVNWSFGETGWSLGVEDPESDVRKARKGGFSRFFRR